MRTPFVRFINDVVSISQTKINRNYKEKKYKEKQIDHVTKIGI